MADPISLRAVQLAKSTNAMDWTPQECLEEVLADIKSGKARPTKIIICTQTPDEDGDMENKYYCAGVKTTETVGLLTLVAARIANGYDE